MFDIFYLENKRGPNKSRAPLDVPNASPVFAYTVVEQFSQLTILHFAEFPFVLITYYLY